MPLNGPDTTAWTEIGRKVVLPSYYAYVNNAFVNVNAPGAPVSLGDLSRGIVKYKFVPRKGDVNLGTTDPLPTKKQPSEFNVALGVGIYVGFSQAMDNAEAERKRVAEAQENSITEEDLLGCLSALAKAHAASSTILVKIIEAKTLKGRDGRIKAHGYSRK